jgi:CARDB protein
MRQECGSMRETSTVSRHGVCALTVVALLTIAFGVTVATQEAPQLVVGHNVNMSGGEQTLALQPFRVRGDVLGRPSNEPSCAISTRNPQHVLCGANDYRMVDVPGVSVTQVVRDAWQGLFQSIDGAESWESTLHPGFFLDPQPHILKQLRFRALADPALRSGPAGLVFDSGIAFSGPDRDEGGIFISTFSDLNNDENDRMPFKFVRTVVFDRGNSGQFIDKPWLFVEASPGTTCTFTAQTETGPVTQTVPGSIVHVMYAVFTGTSGFRTQIRYVKSTDCGASFSKPIKISESLDSSQGATLARTLQSQSGLLFAAWRRVRRTTDEGTVIPDAIVTVTSRDNGATWTKPRAFSICPFDQSTSSTMFRTTAFPALTVDASGRAYLAWSDRGRDEATGACRTTGDGQPLGNARIMVATSTDGAAWASAQAVPSPTPEHQILPAIAFTAGRLFLAWVDFKDDASGVFARQVNEADVVVNTPAIRHTGDVRAAMALPGATPDFAADVAQVSSYIQGVVPGTSGKQQLQWNAVNRRWARRGTVPFDGDYIDIGTLPYLPGSWIPNTKATQTLANGDVVPISPQVVVVWTDNRDMRRIPGIDDPSKPVPYVVPAGLPGLGPGPSLFDPTQQRLVCTTAADAFMTGATNQNTYSARLGVGFATGSPGNNKDIGGIDRRFVVFVRNDTGAIKTFRLTAIPPPGALASFDQFNATKTTIPILFVPRYSSVTRTVFVSRDPRASAGPDPNATTRVEVVELVGGAPAQATTVYLNSDPSAPEIDSPEIDSKEIFTPEIDSPEIDSPEIDSHGFPAPEIDSPEIDSPEIDSQELLSLGLQTPEIDSPEIDSPEIDSQEIDTPEIDSPEIDSSAVTDITFKVTNTGNTTAQYNARTLSSAATGGANRFQTIVRRRYTVATVDANCIATTTTLSKVAVNIVDLAPGTPEIDSPEIDSAALDTASFFVAPGETVDLVVRVRSANLLSPAELQALVDSVEVAVQPEAVDTVQAAQGITEPPVITSFLSISTTAVPIGIVGVPYSFQLQASGAVGATTWSDDDDSPLPPGLALSSSGLITGIPATAGTFTFSVFVQDSDLPIQTAMRTLAMTITAPGVASVAFVTQPSDTLVGAVISPSPSVRVIDATGAVVPGVAVTLQLIGPGTLSGILTQQTNATGIAVFEGLSVNTLATGLILQATVPGFASGASIAFDTTLPDLIVSSLTHAPANPTTADTITFSAVVTNLGTGHATASTLMFKVGNETPGAPATLFAVPAMTPGASFSVERQLTLGVAQGYVNTAIADYSTAVVESNETNNTTTDSYVVASAVAPITMQALAPAAAGEFSNVGSQQVADDFVLSTPTTLASFSWFGRYGANIAVANPVDFSIRIFADAAGQPANTALQTFDVSVTATPTGQTFGSVPWFAYSTPLGVTLPAGSYWISVLETDPDTPDTGTTQWLWADSSAAGARALRVGEGGTWTAALDVNHAFTLAPAGASSVVNNTNDSGAGSLRQAILNANVTVGVTEAITFNLPGPGPYSIAPTSPLPAITDPLIIDGTSQPGFAGTPIIELNGANAGLAANGLSIAAANTTVQGLVINRFAVNGISVTGGNNTFRRNFIGTDITGTLDLGNGVDGIRLLSAGNIVGGPTAAARNVISGNQSRGVFVSGAGASGNQILGNLVGTDVTGKVALPNVGPGVQILGGASGNIVGGALAGARNVISGNGGNGVSLRTGATNNTVQNNLIGIEIDGTAALGNGGAGVIIGESSTNTILNNVISGNVNGVLLVVQAAPNVAAGNVIKGNFIGTDPAGTLDFGNTFAGVLIAGPATGTVVGGLTAADRNVISGNNGSGIQVADADSNPATTADAASGTIIQGNYIGTTASGTAALGNGSDGILIFQGATNTLVGGTAAGAGNVISGNGFGMSITASNNNTVQGNFIGTDASGTLPLGNLTHAINVQVNASGNLIGGTAAGARNVLGYNTTTGVYLQSGANANVLQNNLIVSNGANGIYINSAPSNTIGGSAANAGNVISGNTNDGIGIEGASATGTLVQGNRIGTTASGLSGNPNGGNGVRITNAPGNTIGGTASGAGNLISGNAQRGVYIFGVGSSGNIVQGNFVGTNAAGTAAIPNLGIQSGVFVQNAPSNTIGGTAAGAGNVISGNAQHAVTVVGATAVGNSIQGNFIGLDATGTAALPNGGIGVDIVSALNTTVGGTGAARNVISGNSLGIQIRTGAAGNMVRGNYIGTYATGVRPGGAPGSPPSNTFSAVFIHDGAVGNTIGGTGAGEGNLIEGNGDGVRIEDATSTGNSILSNSIHHNGFLGINLGGASPTVNDALDADVGPNNLQNFPVITQALQTQLAGTLSSTPNTTFRLEFFVNTVCDGTGFGEGETFIASVSVTTDGSGAAPFLLGGLALPAGSFAVATATDSAGNTSEFSACVQVVLGSAPTATITATDSAASEVGANPGTFTISRTGTTTGDLIVSYTVSGSASNGVDYGTLSGTATVPNGQASL